MAKDLSSAMCKVRSAKVLHGGGEAWFYVNHRTIEVCTAPSKYAPSQHIVALTKRQLQRALQIMETE